MFSRVRASIPGREMVSFDVSVSSPRPVLGVAIDCGIQSCASTTGGAGW
jgi:hypothetical protein